MTDYIYRDNDSTKATLSATLTSRMGNETGSHEAAHLDTINLLVFAFSSGSLIDIGCDMGRIIKATAGKIREIVALEPDTTRCDWARAEVANHEGFTVLKLMTQDYVVQNPRKQFDLAILSWVLEHLSTHNCKRLTNDLATLTRPGGFAAVCTTHAHALDHVKCFTYKHVSQARISEGEFNIYADNSEAQEKGLPVHRFSRADLEAIVPESFEIVQWTQCSYYRPQYLGHLQR